MSELTDAQRRSRPLRVAYLSGPSDADRVYGDIIQERPATYFGTNYMRQFQLLMLDLGAEAHVETWFGDRSYSRRLGPFRFSNIPEPRCRGLGYHIQQAYRQLGVLWRFVRFRPDLVILTGKQGYWWVLSPLRLTRAKLVASFHCVLWPRFGKSKLHEKILQALERALVLRHLDAVVSTSKVITEQFAEAAGGRRARIPVYQHLPTYNREQFASIAPAHCAPGAPFKVIFTGRIEANKGIFDLLCVATELQQSRPGEFEFHLCGDGSQLERLREQVEAAKLTDAVHLHGYCTPDRLRDVMEASHAAIVPTRSDFEAGFEMTCAEAVLSGRPLVTSAVCPALDYLLPAAIEVPPDDVSAYTSAIEQLKDDAVLYAEKRDACQALAEQFYDHVNSWDHAMRLALTAALPRRIRKHPATAAVRS